VAGLELKETMILCGRAAQTTHIKSIAVFFHLMEQIEVASGKFNKVTTEAEFTRLESELSFLQFRATMSLQETICQVKAEIWENGKQVEHTRLESSACAENPYSLMQVFGRDIKSRTTEGQST
jgi:predicted  nucleic acid-binding Zn-ribbon protein